jgi:hypothetical protein
MGYTLAAAVALTVGGLIGLWFASLTALGHPRLPHSHSLSLRDTIGVLQLIFASVAGAGALLALIVAYRRQRLSEARAARRCAA